jgi:hypothetical protein
MAESAIASSPPQWRQSLRFEDIQGIQAGFLCRSEESQICSRLRGSSLFLRLLIERGFTLCP